MTYRTEISSVAQAEVDSIFLRISQVMSLEKAREWYDGLLKEIASLSSMPKRCALARENQYFSKEIRQLIYGKGRNSYRIIFAILESEEVSTVRILRIRHAAQQTLGENQESDEE